MHSSHTPILEQFNALQLQQDREAANTIALIWHLSPDGDCFGSMIALGWVLEKLWKTIHYYTPSKTPAQFTFLWLPEVSQDPIDPSEYDLIIATDVANIERSNLAECDPATYADKFHMIDHHYGNNRTVGKHFLFEDIKSCCEIIAVILMDTYPQHIDEDIATLLLMGILTDSGGFTWSWNRSSDLRTASKLVGDYWAKKERLQLNLFRSNSFEAVQYVWELLSKIEKQWEVISYTIHQSELDSKWLEWWDIDLALFTMTSIDHSWVFIQFKIDTTWERPMLKCGFRTKSHSINVSSVAGLFGGWGHKQASWARIRIQWDPQEMIERVITKVNEFLENS